MYHVTPAVVGNDLAVAGLQMPHSLRHFARPSIVLLVPLLGIGLYAAVLHPWMMTWGATSAEQAIALPGDELDGGPPLGTTRAITIDAPASEVWSWVIQIGQDRGGWYSYAWLENLVTADIHDVNRINPGWQERAVGDAVPMARDDILGGALGDDINGRVALVVPGQALVLTGFDVTIVVVPMDETTSRLLVRDRTTDDMPGWLAWAVWDPLHFTMERQMMLGLKHHAEGTVPPHPVLTVVARVGFLAAAVATAAFFLHRRSPWLLLPVLAAAPALVKTGDLDAALAGFLAAGISIAGFLAWGRRWVVSLLAIATVVLLSLVVASDAWVVIGLGCWIALFAGLSHGIGQYRGAKLAPIPALAGPR